MALRIQFPGQFLESARHRTTGEHSEEIPLCQRLPAQSKLEYRLYLLERVPQLGRKTGQFQRALDRFEQVLCLVEQGRKRFNRAIRLQYSLAQPAKRVLREAELFAKILQRRAQ